MNNKIISLINGQYFRFFAVSEKNIEDHECLLPIFDGNNFIVETSGFILFKDIDFPHSKAVTKNVSSCTAIALKVISNGEAYLGLAHIFIDYKAHKNLIEYLSFIEQQVFSVLKNISKLTFFIDYYFGVYSEHETDDLMMQQTIRERRTMNDTRYIFRSRIWIRAEAQEDDLEVCNDSILIQQARDPSKVDIIPWESKVQ